MAQKSQKKGYYDPKKHNDPKVVPRPQNSPKYIWGLDIIEW